MKIIQIASIAVVSIVVLLVSLIYFNKGEKGFMEYAKSFLPFCNSEADDKTKTPNDAAPSNQDTTTSHDPNEKINDSNEKSKKEESVVPKPDHQPTETIKPDASVSSEKLDPTKKPVTAGSQDNGEQQGSTAESDSSPVETLLTPPTDNTQKQLPKSTENVNQADGSSSKILPQVQEFIAESDIVANNILSGEVIPVIPITSDASGEYKIDKTNTKALRGLFAGYIPKKIYDKHEVSSLFKYRKDKTTTAALMETIKFADKKIKDPKTANFGLVPIVSYFDDIYQKFSKSKARSNALKQVPTDIVNFTTVDPIHLNFKFTRSDVTTVADMNECKLTAFLEKKIVDPTNNPQSPPANISNIYSIDGRDIIDHSSIAFNPYKDLNDQNFMDGYTQFHSIVLAFVHNIVDKQFEKDSNIIEHSVLGNMLSIPILAFAQEYDAITATGNSQQSISSLANDTFYSTATKYLRTDTWTSNEFEKIVKDDIKKLDTEYKSNMNAHVAAFKVLLQAVSVFVSSKDNRLLFSLPSVSMQDDDTSAADSDDAISKEVLCDFKNSRFIKKLVDYRNGTKQLDGSVTSKVSQLFDRIINDGEALKLQDAINVELESMRELLTIQHSAQVTAVGHNYRQFVVSLDTLNSLLNGLNKVKAAVEKYSAYVEKVYKESPELVKDQNSGLHNINKRLDSYLKSTLVPLINIFSTIQNAINNKYPPTSSEDNKSSKIKQHKQNSTINAPASSSHHKSVLLAALAASKIIDSAAAKNNNNYIQDISFDGITLRDLESFYSKVLARLYHFRSRIDLGISDALNLQHSFKDYFHDVLQDYYAEKSNLLSHMQYKYLKNSFKKAIVKAVLTNEYALDSLVNIFKVLFYYGSLNVNNVGDLQDCMYNYLFNVNPPATVNVNTLGLDLKTAQPFTSTNPANYAAFVTELSTNKNANHQYYELVMRINSAVFMEQAATAFKYTDLPPPKANPDPSLPVAFHNHIVFAIIVGLQYGNIAVTPVQCTSITFQTIKNVVLANAGGNNTVKLDSRDDVLAHLSTEHNNLIQPIKQLTTPPSPDKNKAINTEVDQFEQNTKHFVNEECVNHINVAIYPGNLVAKAVKSEYPIKDVILLPILEYRTLLNVSAHMSDQTNIQTFIANYNNMRILPYVDNWLYTSPAGKTVLNYYKYNEEIDKLSAQKDIHGKNDPIAYTIFITSQRFTQFIQ